MLLLLAWLVASRNLATYLPNVWYLALVAYPQRIEFKILTFMQNCLVGIAPSYLGSLCILPRLFLAAGPFVQPIRVFFLSPGLIPLQLSTEAFAFVGPVAWNNLPHKTRAEPVSLSPSLFRKALEVYSVWTRVLLVGSGALLMSFSKLRFTNFHLCYVMTVVL